MRDVFMDMDRGLTQWEDQAGGNPDWETIFASAQSTCDWPGARYYKELLEYYPDSRVVLSVRSPDTWVRSMRDTIWAIYFGDSVMHHLCEARAVLDPLWKRFMDLMVMTWRDPGGALAPPEATFDDAGLAAAMDRWNDQVKADVPADRLLVWEPREGWAPLCEFLEVPNRCRTSTTRQRSRRGSWVGRSGCSMPGGTSANGPAAGCTTLRSTSS
jgi:Sulfotransferase domain